MKHSEMKYLDRFENKTFATKKYYMKIQKFKNKKSKMQVK